MIPDVVGSNPIAHPKLMVLGPLAQLVEQLTLNQLVVGSNPTRPTTLKIRRTGSSLRLFFLVSLEQWHARRAPVLQCLWDVNTGMDLFTRGQKSYNLLLSCQSDIDID